MRVLKAWINSKISIAALCVVMVAAIAFVILTEVLAFQAPAKIIDQQLQAAELMRACTQAAARLRESLGVAISVELDPNRTGLIGEEFAELTTTLGDLAAKRTATNPDFAALMVKYFTEAGLKEGDVVAIGASGSFPGLILATLAAARVLDLRPIIIYSLGASMYGATQPDFTMVQILEHLNDDEGLLPYRMAAISLGGHNDQAEGMFYKSSQEIMRALAYSAGVTFIDEPDMVRNIRLRMEIYRSEAEVQGQPVSCFVNIGGATPNYGDTMTSLQFPNGLVLHANLVSAAPDRGLIFEYAARGIPVINMINIEGLAVKNGLPVDPVPLPKPGSSGVYSGVYYERQTNGAVAVVGLVVILLLILNMRQRNRGKDGLSRK